MKLVPHERTNERTVEGPVLHFREEKMVVANLVPRERIDELCVDVPAPHIFEETVEMESRDQVLHRVVEHIVVCLVDVTGLQTLEEHQRGDAGRRLSP